MKLAKASLINLSEIVCKQFHLRSCPSDPEPVMSKNSPGATWVMVTSAKTLPVGVNMWLILVRPTWRHTGQIDNESEKRGICFKQLTLVLMKIYMRSTLGMVLANRRSSSLWESVPFTMNLAKGVKSITPTFSITSLHSLPTGPNQLVRRKLGLSTTQKQWTLYIFNENPKLFFYWLFLLAPLHNEKLMWKYNKWTKVYED